MSDQQEGMEGMEALWRGQKGAKGDQGEKGAKGDRGEPLSPALRRAIAYLLLLAIALCGANLAWTAHEVSASHAAQVREQLAQRKQGALIEHKICTDLSTMASIIPPSGPAATNPSRSFEQAEHRAWAGLVLALGCR